MGVHLPWCRTPRASRSVSQQCAPARIGFGKFFFVGGVSPPKKNSGAQNRPYIFFGTPTGSGLNGFRFLRSWVVFVGGRLVPCGKAMWVTEVWGRDSDAWRAEGRRTIRRKNRERGMAVCLSSPWFSAPFVRSMWAWEGADGKVAQAEVACWHLSR